MFIVYSKNNCQQCDIAKSYLSSLCLTYKVINLDQGQQKLDGLEYISKDALLRKMPTARTMPQIFEIINNEEVHIGTFIDLQKLLHSRNIK